MREFLLPAADSFLRPFFLIKSGEDFLLEMLPNCMAWMKGGLAWVHASLPPPTLPHRDISVLYLPAAACN